MLDVTAVAASVLGLWLVALSANVIRLRRQLDVGLGDGGHDELYRAIRAHANFVEYAPMGLLLLACLELNHAPSWLTLVCALSFVTGRLLHPIGIRHAQSPWQCRVFGMVLTLTALVVMAVAGLFLVVVRV